jgi:DNA-directed RNA polymerase subunit RPC12/RpoP
MGNDLGFLCTHCGFSESLSIGGGNGPLFRYPSIDTLVKAVGKKEARVLRTLEETQGAFVREMPVEAYYTCPKCKTLHSHLYYEVIYDGGKKYTKEYHCEKCGNPLLLLPRDEELDISQFRCKKCGKQSLIETGVTLFWD